MRLPKTGLRPVLNHIGQAQAELQKCKQAQARSDQNCLILGWAKAVHEIKDSRKISSSEIGTCSALVQSANPWFSERNQLQQVLTDQLEESLGLLPNIQLATTSKQQQTRTIVAKDFEVLSKLF